MRYQQIGRRATGGLLLIALLVNPARSSADEEQTEVKRPEQADGVGIDPEMPRITGSDVTSGAPPLTIRTSRSNWEFGFHGYLRAPFRFSWDSYPVKRYVMEDGEPVLNSNGQYRLKKNGDRDFRFNMPHRAPDNNYPVWQFTNNLSGPWTELNFSFGNSIAVGHMQIAAWNQTDAGWRNHNTQLGINQAWVTLNWPRLFGALGGIKVNVGAFDNRYGSAGRYDAGYYDTYIFGRTHIAGETLTAYFDLTPHLTLFVEHGFGGKTDVLQENPKRNFSSDDNRFDWIPYPNNWGQNPAFVNHAHIGLLSHTMPLWDELWINAHFMHSFSNSADASDNPNDFTERDKDGKYIIGGAEVKFNDAKFGNVYLGFSTITTDGLAKMPDAIEVLHSQEGYTFLKNFYGDQMLTTTKSGDASRHDDPNPGTGRVNTLAWQYTFSLAKWIWYLHNKHFWGQAADFQLSFFGMFNMVNIDKDIKPYLKRAVDKKLKLGADAMYTPLPWLGVGVRFDHVRPDLDYDEDDKVANRATLSSYAPFSIITPKIRIKTAFVTHEEINIAYARYLWSGPRDAVRAENMYFGEQADRNAFMISVNMWW